MRDDLLKLPAFFDPPPLKQLLAPGRQLLANTPFSAPPFIIHYSLFVVHYP